MRVLCISLALLIFMTAGCSADPKTITGTVIDNETGKPVEGAVVLVEWTRSHGLGLTYTTSDRVVEIITDKDGKFIVDNAGRTIPPDVAVYKKGYVTWSSRWIFPDRRNRTDFKWRSVNIYILDKFKDTYSYVDHTDFITSSINSSINLENKQAIYRAFYWEDQLASKEREQRSKQRKQ